MAEKSLWLHPEGKEIFSSLLLSLILPLIFASFRLIFFACRPGVRSARVFAQCPRTFPSGPVLWMPRSIGGYWFR